MKVAVTSAGEGLDAEVDPRFGRCNQFVVVDIDEMKAESFPNESALATGGAGIQAAQKVAELGVDACSRAPSARTRSRRSPWPV